MTTQIKRRRGTAAEHSTFTGAEGELTVNTTNESVHVHDGSTAGGFELARADGSNLAMGSDLTFGDNDKAIFGAGSDLQIYHDGSNSYIVDTGTGALRLRGASQVQIGDTNGELFFLGNQNASVNLYYDNSVKLATTSTGIDVTGTVTADRLDIDFGTANSAAALIDHTDTANGNGVLITAGGSNSGKYVLNARDGSGNNKLYVDSNGDISFYEDTGTTAKFFWDASAESLGIGTTTPTATLDIERATGTVELQLQSRDSSDTLISFGDNADGDIGQINYAHSDNSMRFTTAASERMRIDSSGNVGIGSAATDPYSLGSTGKTLVLNSSNSSTGALLSLESADTNRGYLFGNLSNIVLSAVTAIPLVFKTTDTERMRIDSSGRVGIGTSSPEGKLRLSGDGTYAGGGLVVDNGAQRGYVYQVGTNLRFEVGSSSYKMTWGQAGATEHMTLDSSGNLLVGKTTTDFGVAGINLESDGNLGAIRSGAAAGNFNRLSSDGDIVKFFKDSTTVGSIGSEGGDSLYIQSGTTSGAGLHFHPTAGNINPARNGDKVDNVLDLGRSTHRFKNLYLSGGVYLGGTGSANYLDDYEEGAWTPTVEGYTTAGSYTITPTNCRYTKIGRLVTVTGKMAISVTTGGTGIAKFGGLPFTSLTNSYGQGNVRLQNCDTTAGLNLSITGWTSNSTDFAIAISRDNAGATSVQASELSSSTTVEIIYQYEAS